MHKTIAFWGVCAILVFVPLPIGSVEEWAIFVFEAATLVLFLIYAAGTILTRKKGAAAHSGSGTGDGRIPRAVKILLGIFLGISILQILPLPHAIVKIFSPRAAAIYQGLARDGLAGWDARSWWTLSLAPRLSVGKLVLLICYGLFAFLVLRTVRSRRRIEIFALVMIGSALFQAFYGMAETFSGTEMIFGRQKEYNIGSVTGTYVNRNHFAGLMEMIFPLSLGYLLAKSKYFLMEKGLTWRQKFLWLSQGSVQRTFLFGLGSVFIGTGLIFSKSRSGVMIFLVTLLLAAAAIGSWRELSESADDRKRLKGIVRMVAAAVLGLVLWVGIGPVIERFGEMDVSREARRTFMSNTLKMIGGFPLAGTGKGTYLYAYPMYKKVDDRLQLSYAHNDYLEYTAENGIIAGGCLIAAGIWLFVFLAGKWRKRRNNFAKGVGLGAILGILALLIHGFTDFNLQIPANAVYFVGLSMLAMNVVAMERGRESRGEVAETGGEKRVADGIRAWKVVVGAAAAVALFVVAAREYQGFYYLGQYQAARSGARSVQSAFPELEGWLKKATSSFGNPEVAKEMARLEIEMARAENDSGRGEKRDAYCDKAVASYETVLGRNPIDSTAHYEMGMTYLLYNYPLMTYADKAKLYFRKALELDPSDEFLHLNILFYYLTAWDWLGDEEKAYAASRLKYMKATDPGFMPQLEQRWTKQFGSADKLGIILRSVTK